MSNPNPKYLATIYCSLSGEPRVLLTEVYADQPVGVLDKDAYDMLRVVKSKTQLNDFEEIWGESMKDLRDRLLGVLGQIIEEPLASTHTIETIWPNGPPGGKVHVAVIEKDPRDKNLMTISSLNTPSECSKNPAVIYTDPATLGGRPLGGRGLPVALYNSPLAVLTDDLANLDSGPAPPARILELAMEFIRISLEFYPHEVDCERAIGVVMDLVFPGANWQKKTTKEYKDAKGGTPDATWDDGGTQLRGRSVMPMVLLSLASTQLEVCAAVYTDAAQVDHLVSMNFHDSVHLEEQVLCLGRVFVVLQTCLKDLKIHYATLRQKLASLLPADSSVHLPSPVSVSAASRQITADLDLRFLYKLSRDTGEPVDPRNVKEWQKNTQHGVFVALGGGQNGIPNQEVIVKFARRYNTEAHQMLAEKDLAPKLYYHCLVRGGLTMVVMEKCTGHYGQSLDPEDLSPRLQNIMVCQRNDHEAHAVLVDFDWAGTAGEARYPATISKIREWAPTVEAYGLMERGHDVHRLKAMEKEEFNAAVLCPPRVFAVRGQWDPAV
ncbi:hypothetical protein GGX14DRAFT_390804 [Mycena pura]|uniref:Uncharacterized protein n=1 Tax=Mycena pura TaxID=153505 RepID=A0AAD6VNE9_9AGAR|nr:hypothetical protein GGX14DRAFT_390804 [Mycena pura]